MEKNILKTGLIIAAGVIGMSGCSAQNSNVKDEQSTNIEKNVSQDCKTKYLSG